MRNRMGNAVRRLGMNGLIIVAAALIFGVLAGGVVVHRLETASTASQQQQSEVPDKQDEQGQQAQKKSKGHGHGHAKPAQSPEPSDSPESD